MLPHVDAEDRDEAAPSISGLSWFGVVTISTAPPLPTASHAQPEPKTPAADAANLSLNSSNEPKAASIFSASTPDGAPPAFGPMIVQNMQWL